jgi:hypothetical protein
MVYGVWSMEYGVWEVGEWKIETYVPTLTIAYSSHVSTSVECGWHPAHRPPLATSRKLSAPYARRMCLPMKSARHCGLLLQTCFGEVWMRLLRQ